MTWLAHSGLSKSHFMRVFKEQTGFSPMDYFIQLKMQHACMLLAFRQDSVSQIGTELGYEDQYYFSRAFSKTIGMSPTAVSAVQLQLRRGGRRANLARNQDRIAGH